MEQILKTRKTVKYYVVFNLIFLYISMAIGVMIELNKNPDVLLQTSKFPLLREKTAIYLSLN